MLPLYLQSLCFLIRDWSNPDDYPYGRDGGSGYIDTVLKVSGSLQNLGLVVSSPHVTVLDIPIYRWFLLSGDKGTA